MYRDYAPKGVKFYYVYKALAHPEVNGYVTPFTLDERLMHVQEAKRTLGSEIPWLCDTMENSAKHALGDAPNSEFILDPDGKIVEKRFWSNPNQLREDLAGLVGEVDNPTRVGDLGLDTASPPERAKTGVVEPLDVPRGMRPLKVVPIVSDSDEHPFYVKLRAEADNGLLGDGEGQVYLRFSLDPLYQVHWNNQTDAPRYSIAAPSGVKITPDSGQSPTVEEKADADPREFLLEVSGADTDKPLELEFHYFACDDAETFCVPVTQKYLVYFERDSDGGSRMSGRGGGRGLQGGGRQGGAAGNRGAMARQMMERMKSFDANEDGKISKAEVEGTRAEAMFDRMDANGDGEVDESELQAMVRRMTRGRRGGGER